MMNAISGAGRVGFGNAPSVVKALTKSRGKLVKELSHADRIKKQTDLLTASRGKLPIPKLTELNKYV